MKHQRIEIPKENYYEIMSKLGSIKNSIEFEDLNKNEIESLKPHYSIINRCDNIETIFNHINDILIKINQNQKQTEDSYSYNLYNDYNDFKSHLKFEINKHKQKILEKNFLDYIQNIVSDDEIKIKSQYNLNKQLLDSFHELLEKKYTYEKMLELFHGKIVDESEKEAELKNDYVIIRSDEEEKELLKSAINKSVNKDIVNFFYLCGICNTEDILKLRRHIFRWGKGRAVPSFYNTSFVKENLIYDEDKYLNNKQIFLIIIEGENPFLKIKNNLEIFNCQTYRITNILNIRKDLESIKAQIEEQKKIVIDSEKNLLNLVKNRISPVRGVCKNYKSLYALFRTFCKREKYIYMNLNRCKEVNSFYIGDVWIPETAFDNLNNKIKDLIKDNEDILLPEFYDSDNSDAKLRTYFQMDDFVYPFQTIVDTYGIPRYKEVNPGLFSIISFPFLFGIMFGDIGHGILLLLFSLYIELNSEKIKNSDSVLNSLVKFRYILILMGFFSFFCGIIYNDFMSIPLTFFSSCYINDKKNGIAKKKINCIYPIGIDPKWYAATNDLAYMNSFKMKWSVIIGVIQMTLGIILRGLNNLFFKDYLGFFFEFIPQIIFMLLLFGYMIALIFIKWGTDYSKNTSKAPSIITILMNLALKGGSVEEKPVWSSVKTEEETNKMFFYIALICIPIILLPKPLIIIYKNYQLKKKTFDFDNKIKQNEEAENENIISIEMSNINNIMNENIKDEIEPLLENDELPKAEKEYDKLSKDRKEQPVIEDIKNVKEETASDILVHQIIETIEFVLGCVSNTASYLRLWALSLAHSQLSKVFFEKSLLGVAINMNFLVVIIGYFLFANITISVLMGMDLLEAFLHTLRLHWVEFQNKFYYADGTAFVPYSFNLLLEGEK